MSNPSPPTSDFSTRERPTGRSRRRQHDGMAFRPRLDVTSAARRQLRPALADVPEPFVLYRGTALALRLARRTKAAATSLDARRPAVR